MPDRNTIVAIIEPDIHPREVAERGIFLARKLGCDLELLFCDPDIGPLDTGWISDTGVPDYAAKIEAAQTEIIDELAADLDQDDVTVTTDVLVERPMGDAIIDRVKKQKPRLLVKGTQHHSDADRAIFVHTDWLLVRTCPCPVYLAKPRSLEENPMIVAAVDPMHSHDKPAALDNRIIEFARGMATKMDGAVHLVHTYHRLVGVGREATRTFKPLILPVEEISERMQAEHRQKLDALAEKHQIDTDNVHQLPGSARELIPMFARTHGADIVVMGALARWGIKRAIIGSTAERVIDSLPCDVLIVTAGSRWADS